MATGWYIGVDGKARKVKAAYVGVGGKARKVKAGYVGVNGKARKFYTGRLVLEHTLRYTGPEASAQRIISFYQHELKYDSVLPQSEAIPAQFIATSDPLPMENVIDFQFGIEDSGVHILCWVYINGQDSPLTENMWKAGDVVECVLDTINKCIYFTQ